MKGIETRMASGPEEDGDSKSADNHVDQDGDSDEEDNVKTGKDTQDMDREEGEGEDSQGSDSDSSSSRDEDDSSSSDEDSDNEDMSHQNVEATSAAATDEHGHPLSAYELQRLERIRRNKEYLASLGLEKNKPSMALKAKKKTTPARKKRPDVKRRSSISRASKTKAISYSERRDKEDAATATAVSKAAVPWKRPKENRAARMERFIYDEFKRIGADQKRTLKRAQKNVRAADVEYRIAKQRAERYERRRRKELEMKQLLEQLEQERRILGGCTARGMLQEVDSRMYEICMAIRSFDERFHVCHH